MAGKNSHKENDVAASHQGDKSKIDYYLKAAGVTLGVVCGLLPLFAYMQRIDFSLSGEGDLAIVDPLDRSERKTILRFPSFRPIALAAGVEGGADQAVLSNGEGLPGFSDEKPATDVPASPDKPAPTFALEYVEGNMALIKDNTGYWLVQPGSFLPDGSRFETLSQSSGSGTWQLTTSKGQVVQLLK